MNVRSWKCVGLGVLAVTLGLAATPASAAVSCTIFCQSFNPIRFYNQSSPSVSSCDECKKASERLQCNGSDPSGYACATSTGGDKLDAGTGAAAWLEAADAAAACAAP